MPLERFSNQASSLVMDGPISEWHGQVHLVLVAGGIDMPSGVLSITKEVCAAIRIDVK